MSHPTFVAIKTIVGNKPCFLSSALNMISHFSLLKGTDVHGLLDGFFVWGLDYRAPCLFAQKSFQGKGCF